jgi:hypothetical protein
MIDIFKVVVYVKLNGVACYHEASFHSGALPGDFQSPGSAPKWKKVIGQLVVLDGLYYMRDH